MSDFRESIAEFREAMRREGESAESPGLHGILERGRARAGARFRWPLAAAVLLVVGAVPLWRSAEQRRELARERADELLMQQVNASLSRGVPRAMEPLLEPVFLNEKENQ
jgi:hypothetical protein